jgi:hypothetical protein
MTTHTWTDESGNQWRFTFAAGEPRQPQRVTATIAAARRPVNRFIQGETFVARDWFPQLPDTARKAK